MDVLFGKIYFYSSDEDEINDLELILLNFNFSKKKIKHIETKETLYLLKSDVFEFACENCGNSDKYKNMLDFLNYLEGSGVFIKTIQKIKLTSIFSLFTNDEGFSDVIPLFIVKKIADLGLSLEVCSGQGPAKGRRWKS